MKKAQRTAVEESKRVRNRIIDRVEVTGRDLKRNPLNWRTHPENQTATVRSLIDTVGQVSPLIGVRGADGQITLIDGHLRADIADDALMQVDIVDLTPEEQRLILALYDHSSTMAGVDASVISDLSADLAAAFPAAAEHLEAWASLASMAAVDQFAAEASGSPAAKVAAGPAYKKLTLHYTTDQIAELRILLSKAQQRYKVETAQDAIRLALRELFK